MFSVLDLMKASRPCMVQSQPFVFVRERKRVVICEAQDLKTWFSDKTLEHHG